MTEDEAVAELDAMTAGEDAECAHGGADSILLEFAPERIREAFLRACTRVGFWYA